MQKKLIYAAVAIALGLGIYWLTNSKQVETPAPTGSQQESEIILKKDGTTITYTDQGYTPQTIKIKPGTTLTFVNESGNRMWTASDVHPFHTKYPNSGISKCGTDEEELIFDACRGIEPGGTYSFQFNEVGSWQYHDHLNPSRGGTVIVE